MVDAWTRAHWRAGGGSVMWWTGAIVVLLLIVVWGVFAIGVPQNPSGELAPLATQVALPQPRATDDALDPKDRLALQRDLIEYAVDSRVRTWTLLAQVIGAVILGIGGYFTWRNLHVTQERLDVDRQAQITNRFTQAIGQLGAELKDGKPNLEVRLGGIYALERIARDSPRDHPTIVEVLIAYVRQNAEWTEPPTEKNVFSGGPMYPELPPELLEQSPIGVDIQAILTVIGRRSLSNDRVGPGIVNLAKTNLFRAILDDAHLEGAYLAGARLDRASLMRVHLEKAYLIGARLEGVFADHAYLEEANLQGARLVAAYLVGAHLEGALLSHACLREAALRDADLANARLETADLTGATLDDADLRNADFFDAHLERASFRGARLEGASFLTARMEEADLRDAHLEEVDSLTPEQVYASRGHGDGAFLPAHWPTDWRERFEMCVDKPSNTPAAP